jgi:hypothetical protein
LWRRVKLPLGEHVTRQETQEVLHAVEELYFFKRYDEAIAFVHRVLDDGNNGGLDGEAEGLLKKYATKCLEKTSTSK